MPELACESSKQVSLEDEDLSAYQNICIEKKLAPEMNVMTKVNDRIRGSC